jgi:hypothetical protein
LAEISQKITDLSTAPHGRLYRIDYWSELMQEDLRKLRLNLVGDGEVTPGPGETIPYVFTDPTVGGAPADYGMGFTPPNFTGTTIETSDTDDFGNTEEGLTGTFPNDSEVQNPVWTFNPEWEWMGQSMSFSSVTGGKSLTVDVGALGLHPVFATMRYILMMLITYYCARFVWHEFRVV